MRIFLASFLFCFLFINVTYATHQRAAEVTYKHIEGLTFEFTITMYTRTSSPADDTRTFMPIFWGDDSGSELERIIFEPIPNVSDITYNVYKGRHTFPAPGYYVVSVEDPNRNNGVVNIPNSVNVPMFIESEIIINPFLGVNNSTQLLNPPIDVGCVGKPFIHNAAAYDVDGDSLSYDLVVCKGAGGYDIPGYSYPKTPPGGYFGIDSITGDLLWDSPALQGEYNVAFVVTEWRYGIKVGSVRRDMQIDIVACDHDPPEIYSIDDTCVVAGDFLEFDVVGIDPDGTNVTLEAFGGPFEQAISPAIINPDPAQGNDTVVTTFQWATECQHVRFEPYTAVFKATDDGFPVSLVNFKTVFINVLAPPPENLQAEALGNGVNLSWDKSPCTNAIGYKIYRRSGESGWDPGYCENGVPPYTGFQLIQTIEDVNMLEFRDDNFGGGLVHGINYCYRVTAHFLDEAESIASNETCAYLKRDVPIITHVSNDSADLVAGRVLIIWSKPIELDTIQYPGPYKYLLFRSETLSWDNETLVAEFDGLNDTIYLDTDVNLNTHTGPYSYRVDLASTTVGFIGSSQKASSVYIYLQPTDQEIKLVWTPLVPWQNDRFIIYRKSPGETDYDSIDLTLVPFYRDLGLENEKEYCYVIKAIGHYSLPGLVDPLINFSQIACDAPVDNKPPCKPFLSVESYCEIGENELKMIIPPESCDTIEDCDCDAEFYEIYYKPALAEDFEFIATEDYLEADTVTFIHDNLEYLIGCYYIIAVDDMGNKSDTSDIVCTDECPIYCLPNVFTPNNDGYNDLFVPKYCNDDPLAPEIEDKAYVNPNVEKVDMTIFNRWGKIMFTTNEPEILWDGKNQNNGQDCPPGVYFYVCDVSVYTFEGISTYNLRGSVTIFRGNP